jgi:hypothetical protein
LPRSAKPAPFSITRCSATACAGAPTPSWPGPAAAPPNKCSARFDALKLRSSLTLFDLAEPRACFADAIAAFFQRPDQRTLALLRQSR